MALSPFAIFYSTEARAYETMMFFVAVSSLALLSALERERTLWWAVYVLASLGALYCHYTAVFVLGVQAVWAAFTYRSQVRRVAVANLLVLLGYVPWIPSFLDQRQKDIFVAIIGSGTHLTPATFLEYLLRVLSGHPFIHLDELPGVVWLVALGVAVLAAAGPALVRGMRGRRLARPEPGHVLIVVLALATPVGLVLYALVSSNLYVPRNLTASIPGLVLVLGWLVGSLEPRRAMALAGVMLLVVGVASVRSLDPSRRRPESPAVAHYLDREVSSRDRIVRGLGDVNALPVYLPATRKVLNEDDDTAWSGLSPSGFVYLVRGEVGDLALLPRFTGPGGRYELLSRREFTGLRRLAVGRYTGRIGARFAEVGGAGRIELTPGRDITVTPGVVEGVLEKVSVDAGELTVTGWAIAAGGSAPADAVIVVDGARVVAIGTPNVLRADVAAAHGKGTDGSGFTLHPLVRRPEDLVQEGRLRVFAAVGDRASELKPLS